MYLLNYDSLNTNQMYSGFRYVFASDVSETSDVICVDMRETDMSTVSVLDRTFLFEGCGGNDFTITKNGQIIGKFTMPQAVNEYRREIDTQICNIFRSLGFSNAEIDNMSFDNYEAHAE